MRACVCERERFLNGESFRARFLQLGNLKLISIRDDRFFALLILLANVPCLI